MVKHYSTTLAACMFAAIFHDKSTLLTRTRGLIIRELIKKRILHTTEQSMNGGIYAGLQIDTGNPHATKLAAHQAMLRFKPRSAAIVND